MTTYHHSGKIRTAETSTLWTQMLKKERDHDMRLKNYYGSEHYRSAHNDIFGKNKLSKVSRNARLLKYNVKDQLNKTQREGTHKTHYMADNIDHWTDPAYCIIKPAYRPSEPKPNFN